MVALPLAHEHVGLPPTTAVYSMLHRAAARAGRTLINRVVVSNFDAALRVVRANLGISVIPMQVSRSWAAAGEIVAIPLLDGWAQRRRAASMTGGLPAGACKSRALCAQLVAVPGVARYACLDA